MNRYEIKIQASKSIYIIGGYKREIEVITCIIEADTLWDAVDKAFEMHPEADINKSFRWRMI